MITADEVEKQAQDFERNAANPFRPEHREAWLRCATLLRTLLRERDEAVIAFAKAIEHGDEIHKDWLREAAKRFVNGKPLPVPKQGAK